MNGDDLTAQEKIDRGVIAARLLEDPVLADAFRDARKQFTAEWLATDHERAQLAAWAKIHGLDAIHEQLRRTVANGQIEAEIARRRSK